MPTFPSGWPYTPGNAAYYLAVTLACGSTWTSPANDTWQSAQYFAPNGQSNFLASAVNSTFDIAFVQHQPGPYCETLIDKPFNQNLEECFRYYSKTYGPGAKEATVGYAGCNPNFVAFSATGVAGFGVFRKSMAVAPTVRIYSPSNGAANTINDVTNVAAFTVSSPPLYINTEAFLQLGGATGLTLGRAYYVHYAADTGW
jgi:hypothetical protein